MRRIVITTPSGRIGSKVVDRLLHLPTVSLTLVERNPERLPELYSMNCQVIQGDLLDSSVWSKALEGTDALFWCTPPPGRNASGIQEHYQALASLVARQITGSSLKQVVTVSSGGKGWAQPAGYITALHHMEDVLNETGVAMRHLRTASHMENYLNQLVPITRFNRFGNPLPGDFAFPLVAARDIAASAAYWLKDGDWTGQRGVVLHGPEDLSCQQIAAKFSTALGKPVVFETVPEVQFKQTILEHAHNQDLASNLLNMYREIGRGIYQVEPRTPESTTPTTFDVWIEETFKPTLQTLTRT